MVSSRCAITLSGSIPSASAWKVVTIRCRRTGPAICRTSPAVAANRPSSTARVFAARISDCPARGPAPGDAPLHQGRRLGLIGATGPHEVPRVDEDMLGHRHAPDEALDRHDLLGRERHLRDAAALAGRLAEDLQLLVGRRIRHADIEHEPVELGLGERVRPLLLDRVLSRQDEERVGQAVRLVPRRDVPLLHRLQERGLGLGGRPVDLVGEDDVGEQGPGDEGELAPAGLGVVLEDVGPGDVRGHHVGRELDAAERQAQDPRHGAHEQRLRQPRHADEQGVASGEEARQELLDDLVLADDRLGDLATKSSVGLGQRGHGGDLVARGLGMRRRGHNFGGPPRGGAFDSRGFSVTALWMDVKRGAAAPQPCPASGVFA